MGFLAAVPAATWLAGGALAVSAVGSAQQGRAQASSLQYSQNAANQNAQILQQQSAVAQQQQQRQAQQRLGAMLASVGASGLAGSSSLMDVMSDSARQAEFERQSISYNYQLKANGQLAEAAQYRGQISDASTAGMLGVFSSATRFGASAYGMYGGSAPATGAGTGTTLSQYYQADLSRGFTF